MAASPGFHIRSTRATRTRKGNDRHENRDHRPAGFRQGRARGLPRPRRHTSPACSARRKRKARGPTRSRSPRRRSGVTRVPVAVAQGRRRRRTRCARSTSTSASWPTCCSSRRRISSTSRSTARSSTTRRCCRCTAARARSTGRSSAATRKTGLTIFRPTDGLDEGPVILQKEAAIGPDDTLGSVYFERLFPLGVAAMLEAADLVVAGRHTETVQDESQASYEGWCRAAEAKIYWHDHVDHIYDLIRGCNPGARRVDHARGQEAADLRRAQAPGAHVRRGQGQDRRSRGRRRRQHPRSPRTAARSRCSS